MTAIFDLTRLLAQAPAKPNPILPMIVLFIIMFGFMSLMKRSQRKKEEKHGANVAKLIKGDEVMLDSGIYGSINSVEQDTMLVKIADKCIVKVHQRSIRQILKNETEPSTVAK
jgi:preprotein translocase subunit YajC